MLFGDFEEDNFRKEAMGKDGAMIDRHFKVDSSTDGSKVQNNSSFELLAYIASE